MSVLLTSCITCDNVHIYDLETLLRMALMCDGSGNAYFRTMPATTEEYCGLISDYTAVTRTVDGVDYTGIYITHGLGKTTGLFLAVTDDQSKPVSATGYIIDADTFFLVTDGLTDGGFCLR